MIRGCIGHLVISYRRCNPAYPERLTFVPKTVVLGHSNKTSVKVSKDLFLASKKVCIILNFQSLALN